ncbi:MAG: protein-export chaperone SecB [Candidatus Cloacimonadales bacterium]
MNNSNFKFNSYKISKVSIDLADNISDEKLIPNFQHFVFIDDENNRKAKIRLDLSIKSESGKIKIHVIIDGFFEAHPQMDEERFSKMCSMNAPAILFPYARAIISNFTLQCNIKPIIFPLVNLAKNTNN